MITYYKELQEKEYNVTELVEKIHEFCTANKEDSLLNMKRMKEITHEFSTNKSLINELKLQIIWNFSVKSFFLEEANNYFDADFLDWSLTIFQRLVLICGRDKNAWKYFLNDEIVPLFHEKMGLILFKLISSLGLETPVILAEYNACNVTGASSGDLDNSHIHTDLEMTPEKQSPIREKQPEPSLKRTLSSRAMFSDYNIDLLCDMNTKPPVLNAMKEFNLDKSVVEKPKNLNLMLMPMTSRTKLTAKPKSKRKATTPTSRKSPRSATRRKKTPTSSSKSSKLEDKVSTTPKRRVTANKNLANSGSSKLKQSSVKVKKILETPNPDKYKPRWERAIEAAAKKTDKDYKIAESPMKAIPTSPLTSPIRRLRSIPAKSFNWTPFCMNKTQGDMNTPSVNYDELSQSSLSQTPFSKTMNKAEMWRRNQMLEELSLSQFDSIGFDGSNLNSCDTLNLEDTGSILTRKSAAMRRKSNLFDQIHQTSDKPSGKCDTQIEMKPPNPALLTPSKLMKIMSPVKALKSPVKFDPFKSPIKSSLKSPIKSPGSAKRVSISNFNSKYFFSAKRRTENSYLDSPIITPLNFNEKIIASSPLIRNAEEKRVLESPKIFGTSPVKKSTDDVDKENIRPAPAKKRGRPNSKLNKALIKSSLVPRTSYKNPDLGHPSEGFSFASIDEDTMFLDKEQFFKKQTNSNFTSADYRTPLVTPIKPIEETPMSRKRDRPDPDSSASAPNNLSDLSTLDSSSISFQTKRRRQSQIDPRLSPRVQGMNFISRSNRLSKEGLPDETPKIYSITQSIFKPNVMEKNNECDSNTQSSTSRIRNQRHAQLFGDTFDSMDTLSQINYENDNSVLDSADPLKVQSITTPLNHSLEQNAKTAGPPPILNMKAKVLGDKKMPDAFESPFKRRRQRSGTGARRALFK